MKTIACFNNKGGVGKTTLLYHLAWMFSELGLRVVAVDLDPQSNLTSMFLSEERLGELWDGPAQGHTIVSAVAPLLEEGTGDVQAIQRRTGARGYRTELGGIEPLRRHLVRLLDRATGS